MSRIFGKGLELFCKHWRFPRKQNCLRPALTLPIYLKQLVVFLLTVARWMHEKWIKLSENRWQWKINALQNLIYTFSGSLKGYSLLHLFTISLDRAHLSAWKIETCIRRKVSLLTWIPQLFSLRLMSFIARLSMTKKACLCGIHFWVPAGNCSSVNRCITLLQYILLTTLRNVKATDFLTIL